MRSQKDQVWYHVDVNSAYLSWTAAYRVCILGEDLECGSGVEAVEMLIKKLRDV